MLESLLAKPKNQKIAVLLALAGAISPMTMPIAGLHKFYLKQPLWGLLYLMLFATPIPHIASAIEAVWYLVQDGEAFDRRFNPDGEGGVLGRTGGTASIEPEKVGAIAQALRELESLRQEGLLSEYEFEQKRRQLLDRIA